MKQFIVLMAVLPLLLVFLTQYTLDQKNFDQIQQLQEIVYQAKEQAKQEGCFTISITNQMVNRIKTCFSIDGDSIQLELDTVPKYRTQQFDQRELIHYRVTVPIEPLMAGNRMFGISDDENSSLYSVEGWTASERLRD